MHVVQDSVVYRYTGVPFKTARELNTLEPDANGFYTLLIAKLDPIADQSAKHDNALLSDALRERMTSGQLIGTYGGPCRTPDKPSTWYEIDEQAMSHVIREILTLPLADNALGLYAYVRPDGPYKAACVAALLHDAGTVGFGLRGFRTGEQLCASAITWDLTMLPLENDKVAITPFMGPKD